MKRIALVLCAAVALGAGAVLGIRGQASPPAAAESAVGTTQTTDETALVIGDEAAATPGVATAAGPNALSYFLRMILVLALVLAVVYAAYRLMRRLARPKTAEDSAVKVLASTSLGPGKTVHVLSLGSRAYLVGATESAVSLISEIEDKELVDALVLKAATEPGASRQGTDFAGALGALLGGRNRGQGTARPGQGGRRGGDFLARQRERLRKF